MRHVFTDPIPGKRIVAAKLESITLSGEDLVQGYVALIDEDGQALESIPFNLTTDAIELVAAAKGEIMTALSSDAVTLNGLTMRADRSAQCNLSFVTTNDPLVAAIEQVTMGALVNLGIIPPGQLEA